MKKVNVDLAVMGSGLAGLAAAYRAAKERKLKVAVFEKRPFQGGAVSNCPMAFLTVPPKTENMKRALEVTADFTNHTGDLALARTWFEYSALLPELILEDLGIKALEHVERDPKDYGSERGYGIGFPNGMDIGDYYFLQGRGQGHAAALICLGLRRKLEQLGAELYFSTPITEIVRSDSGEITGAKAISKDGEEIEITCRALLVASGGFSNNKEMLQEELGLTLENDIYTMENYGSGDVVFIHFPNAQLTGDGQKAVWEIGGYKGGMAVTGHCVTPSPGITKNIAWLPCNQMRITQEQPYLWVNKNGQRFMNEECSNQHMAMAAYLSNQPSNCAWLVFDEMTIKKWEKVGVEDDYVYFIFKGLKLENIREQFDEMRSKGNIHVAHADTIEELCRLTGINESGLRETIEEYNEYCRIGEDIQFGKNSKYLMPVKEESGHLYAQKVMFGGYMTMGGVHVNRYCEVLDTDKNVIPGLYGAGDIISGSIFGNPPTNATGTLSQAMSTGMAAADYAAKYMERGTNA